MIRITSLLVFAAMLLTLVACGGGGESTTPATPEGAKAFINAADEELLDLAIRNDRAAWVYNTHITEDTAQIAADADERYVSRSVQLAVEASRFDEVEAEPDVRRRLNLLKNRLTIPSPNDPEASSELAAINARLSGTYGAGKYCPENPDSDAGGDGCYDLSEMNIIQANSRDEAKLLDLWTGWRTVSPPMRADYQRMVELANAGSQELGYADTGALWRNQYDMDPDAFAAELDRLWDQVSPLYEALHCHVRAQLVEQYGSDVVDPTGPIPAHLLGNMWAQSWGNVYPLVAPQNTDPGFDLTERLEAEGYDALKMTRQAESFFTSLNLDPLPETFWQRSQFTKPRDREVVCHASAWDIDQVDDLRIKMCIQVTAEDFSVIHHELGHNFYQRAYAELPFLYRNSANDGFHEALGDTISLSVTPKYLKDVGLIDAEPPADADLGLLLRMALDKVAFVPFGLLVDQWRWKVFSGEVSPEEYNQGWWELREAYQGVAAPVERSEANFDPGAKYHVPGNTPYTRYFLAHILQFQFHRGLCQVAGDDGPLHRCSIYGNAAAGERLAAMMELGLEKPWPDALEALTGEREMDATAILEYFAPLQTWLDEQNAGRQCGW
ncbi:MAG: M2 family metallopeptidase [Acidobacteriota bacterium]